MASCTGMKSSSGSGCHSRIPCTKADETHRQVLTLQQFEDTIKDAKHIEKAGFSSPLEHLLMDVRDAETDHGWCSWHNRLVHLEASIARSGQVVDELQAAIAQAQALLLKLHAEFVARQTQSVLRLQAAVRARQARKRAAELRRRAAMTVQECSAAAVWQARIRSYLARQQLRRLRELNSRTFEFYALFIQRWWRDRLKIFAKAAKRRRMRERKKGKKDAVPDGECEADDDAAKVEELKDIQSVIHGVIQQYMKVPEKEKRAVLGFFLNQLKYGDSESRIIIFVNDEQHANGLRNALHMSVSVTLPILCVQESNEEYATFRALKNSVVIIPAPVFSQGVDVSHANIAIVFDMPSNLAPYLMKLGGAKSITYVATSDGEVDLLKITEEKLGFKLKQLSCLVNLAMTERRDALKRKLAVSGSRRNKGLVK